LPDMSIEPEAVCKNSAVSIVWDEFGTYWNHSAK
jgi:hypothetical protein